MNIRRTLCFAAVLALPRLTPAESSTAGLVLGQMECMFNFCAQADSKLADRYKEAAKTLVRDASEKEVTEARNSSEYKETYKAITTELEKMKADKAVEACRAAISEEEEQ